MQELNEQQRDAIDFTEGVAMVVAVPGSGKTLIMVERMARLVREGIAPENILGITFTKNAANTLKNRLRPLLGKQASRLSLSTIHGLCYRMLQSEGRLFTLLDDYKKIACLRRILEKLHINNVPLSLVISEIRFAKNRLISPDEYESLNRDDQTLHDIGQVYSDYEQEKDRRYFLDFDDLLTDTYQLLTENEDVRNKYSNIYRHILIDEYQDTNPAQLEIVKILVGCRGNRSLYVVGDDSQSIYSFTGASVDSILRFSKMFPTAHEFRLTLNYRSTPQILKACSNLISHNKLKIDKELITENCDGEHVIVMEASSADEEANLVASEIEAIITRNLFKLGEIVVLYRANFQSRAIEEALIEHNIPYCVENNTNFYQRYEVCRLLDYLRIIAEPFSKKANEALLNILNVPNRYLSNRFKRELKIYAKKRSIPMFTALQEMPLKILYEQRYTKELTDLIASLQEMAKKTTTVEIISTIRTSLNYDRHISDLDIPCPDDPKIANIDQLQLAASRFDDIELFLDHASRFQRKIIVEKEKSQVRLMTIHKSKGMEFPVVFMIGLVDGLMPMSQGDIEEERRIAFVGMSRASRLLHLSYATKYKDQPSEPSIFLREMANHRTN